MLSPAQIESRLERILLKVQKPDRSGGEPYAFTNQVLGPDNLRAGVSVSGWITGTAGLMYNNMIKYFFGFQPGYTGVRFRPCLPEEWRSVSMVTNLRETQYRLKISKVDREKTTMVVNGTATGSDFIPYRNEKIIDEEIRCK